MRQKMMKMFVALCIVCMGGLNIYAGNYTWNNGSIINSGVYWADGANNLTINGDITINGDVVIANTQGFVGPSDQYYFEVNVSNDSFIHSSPAGVGYGHLIFYAGPNPSDQTPSAIMVYVDRDLIFTGSNTGNKHANNRDLTMTFSGPGQTVFHIGAGKQVGFEGFFGSGGTTGWSDYWDDYTKTGSGVKVYVTMDQTYESAVKNGVNKVVFERSYDTDTNESVKISIGKNSFVTYISTFTSGILDCNDTTLGYGSVAFDPMCYGAGRMLLHIKGSYWVDSAGAIVGLQNAYNDGALVVAGHYVPSWGTPDAIRLGVKLTQPAGVEALFRVIDDQAWRNVGPYYKTGSTLNTDAWDEPVLVGGALDQTPSRRGLLVFNENKSIPSFAADTYVNNAWYNDYIFSTLGKGSTSIRPGFIIGINGTMELFHNTFMDYVAGSTMFDNNLLKDKDGKKIDSSMCKKHNPSALIVDGLGIINVSNFDPADPYDPTRLLYPFAADAASNGGRHAQVLLRGDARIYLRTGAFANGYVDTGAPLEGSGGLGGYIVNGDRTYSFTINSSIGDGRYDGSNIVGASVFNMTNKTVSEGCHALDLEGKLTVRSTSDENQTNESGFLINQSNIKATPGAAGVSRHLARHSIPANYADPRGMINVPPIKIDYRGQEIKNDTLARVDRPLVVDTVYPCYNSSSVFLNAELSLHNVSWHHNDGLKMTSPDSSVAEPAIVGGEKAAYQNMQYALVPTGTANTLYVENPIEHITTKAPLFSLFNSGIYHHESLVVSGIRLVITDKFEYDTASATGDIKLVPNDSILMYYNHGDPLDMLKRGYGRSILFGSEKNTLADGSINAYLQSAYINVYRGWNTDGNSSLYGDGSYNITMHLQTAPQPKYIAEYQPLNKLTEAGVDPFAQVATQVLYLGYNSYSSVGWTSTMAEQIITLADMRAHTPTYSFGINEGFRPRPWDAPWGIGGKTSIIIPAPTPADFLFSLSTEANDAAEMLVDGENFYFGGQPSRNRLKALEPVISANEAAVFYTNHGGSTRINQKNRGQQSNRYYDCFVDTVLAYRQWPRIWSATESQFIDGLSGIVDLPHDQVKFGRSIQPYNLDMPTMMLANDGQTKERHVRLSVYDEKSYGITQPQKSKASGEEVTIPWAFRTDKSVKIGHMDTAPTFTPVKALSFEENTGGFVPPSFRFTDFADDRAGESMYGIATMPEAILTVSAGDVISQMRVSGATKADPFHIYVTGGTNGYGIVREFTSLDSSYFSPGEGCHASIFIDGGGRIGLGSRAWNEHSKKAWNILGADYVTLHPNGNGYVIVNSDLIIADRLPIIPTENFGSYDNLTQVLTYSQQDQRLTFFSDIPREIRILEGGELDLSAFGNPNVGLRLASAYPQQIVFGGKLRLVLEAGAKIRFPSDPYFEPVLYFNDEAQLIFKGTENPDEQIFTDTSEADPIRMKILGVGQIWLNKYAQMRIDNTAFVGVETDDHTPTTSITISIQRDAGMYIGDPNIAGGSFQVGDLASTAGRQIDFALLINGANSRFHMDREGFFGLGVGVVDKFDWPNGNWKINRLYNVKSVTLNIQQGTFDHNQIFQGDEIDPVTGEKNGRLSSLMAIGSLFDPSSSATGTYYLSLGADLNSAIIRGGGNLIYFGEDGNNMYPNLPAGIWYPYDPAIYGRLIVPSNTVDAIYSPNLARVTGDASIIGSTPIIRQKVSSARVAHNYSTNVPGKFFEHLSFISVGELMGDTLPVQSPTKFVSLGSTQFAYRVGYVNDRRVVRTSNISVADSSDVAKSYIDGYLISASFDGQSDDPVLFSNSR